METKEPGNIGASARALKNMGFGNLCLVNPGANIDDDARRFARNAVDILKSADICSCLEDAVRDKSIIAGTTRRTGRSRGIIFPAESGCKRIYELSSTGKVAILFGREDRGLLNNEIEECGFLVTLPASTEQPSLNLAQAVLIIAYELSRAGEIEKHKETGICHKLASHEELRSLYERMPELLKLLDYNPEGDRNINEKIIRNLKHLIGRAGLTDWELRMLHGLFSQIERKIKGAG
jgi:TrmH family RNA methyltransferase